MNRKLAIAILTTLVLTSCRSQNDKIEPQVSYVLHESYVKKLPSAFQPLSESESSEAWAKEYQIGHAFAERLDLYQALTAFKRSDILLPQQEVDRKLEVQYDILLCYYLGAKYEDVSHQFETGALRSTTPQTFPAFHDLLVVMYDSYGKLGQAKKAEGMAQLIDYYYPKTEQKLEISSALQDGDIPMLRYLAEKNPEEKNLTRVLNEYDKEKKSSATARALNAFIPGSGYLYLGQKQSAFTAFFLNTAFIVASYEFFNRGYNAAGIIFTSFEAGWYFGGIYGAGEEAKHYNERIYEKIATPVSNEEKYFPVMMIKYAF